jgi:hypothetical protein
VHKVDIQKYRVHAVALFAGFHSRDNRLKGDPPSPHRIKALEAIAASGELGMLSRALSLATVMFLVGCLAAVPVQAQNLEAGKSPSQIFAGTCSLCHKSSRGLLKTVPPGSLPGFLREHYTTSSDMASLLSAFLISNGATNTRYGGTQPADAKPEAAKPAGLSEQLDWQGRKLPGIAPRQDGIRPDDDGSSPLAPRQGRNAKRPASPGEVPDTANLSERDPDGRKPASKQKLGKRNKPVGEEPPNADTAKTDPVQDEPSKGETAKDDQRKIDPAKDEDAKTESAKTESSKPEGSKPSGEGKSEAVKIDVPKDTGSSGAPALRPDPVPLATPAPASPVDSSSGPSAPAAAPPPPAPPAVTASAPHPPAAAPAGPPVPPISQ